MAFIAQKVKEIKENGKEKENDFTQDAVNKKKTHTHTHTNTHIQTHFVKIFIAKIGSSEGRCAECGPV